MFLLSIISKPPCLFSLEVQITVIRDSGIWELGDDDLHEVAGDKGNGFKMRERAYEREENGNAAIKSNKKMGEFRRQGIHSFPSHVFCTPFGVGTVQMPREVKCCLFWFVSKGIFQYLYTGDSI